MLFSTIYSSISDIFYLSHKKIIHDYLLSPANKRIALEDFELFARSNLDYKQVRFIDSTGMEKIRINWVNDSIHMVQESELQNKKHRYYFSEIMKIDENEIYISPIDLNIENGMVEVPYQTIIRFGSPIIDDQGNKAGIIVINQYLNSFFTKLSQLMSDNKTCELFLLNSDGYYLLAPEGYNTFGFSFNDLKDETFGKYFPEIWNVVNDSEKGLLIDHNDFYFYNSIDLFNRNKILNNKDLNQLVSDKDNHWHFIIHLNYKQISSIKYLNTLLAFSLIILVPVLLLLSFFISRARVKEIELIKELKNLNQELEQKVNERTEELILKNNTLTSVNEELEAFSYSVSHDLRAPLRHIIGFIDLVFKNNKDQLNDKGRYYLGNIKDAATEMRNLIDDLLNFSRVGRNELKLTKVNLEELINEIRPAIEEDFKGHPIIWEIETMPEVKCDYSLIRQVMFNLLHNAAKYSKNKNESIIKIGSISENQSVTIFVEDNGVGFDMNYSHKLFGTFQRLHDKNEFDGSGIGLAIVKRIITRHGGKVWAESKPGNGATFYFKLPQNNNHDIEEDSAG